MAFLPVFRLVALSTTLIFAAVLLGLNAHLTWLTNQYFGGYFAFAALSIATAVLTILTLPILITIEFTRKGKGGFFATILVELIWLCILWVLWLASAGKAAEDNSSIFPDGCGFGVAYIDTACREFAAIVAFNFLTWFALFAYTITVLVLSIMAAKRGKDVWFMSVREGLVSSSGQRDLEAVKEKATPSVNGKPDEPVNAHSYAQMPNVSPVVPPPPPTKDDAPSVEAGDAPVAPEEPSASAFTEPKAPEIAAEQEAVMKQDVHAQTEPDPTHPVGLTNPVHDAEVAGNPEVAVGNTTPDAVVEEPSSKYDTLQAENAALHPRNVSTISEATEEPVVEQVAAVEEPATKELTTTTIVPPTEHALAPPRIEQSNSSDTITPPPTTAPQNYATQSVGEVGKYPHLYPEPQE
ncbi:hypothetical protein VNI00_000919 [Paramarasmius palmivorus]|uniref:MARVEL domain-containing protein n=1 Tax=Paramarasmius palmivorus TaxID=297713 RepID=A0AAW0E5Q1_9AGAR